MSERETVPPAAPTSEPNDPLVDAILRLGEVAESLAQVSTKLIEVARDVTIMRQQQQSMGQEVACTRNSLNLLTERVERLERARRG